VRFQAPKEISHGTLQESHRAPHTLVDDSSSRLGGRKCNAAQSSLTPSSIPATYPLRYAVNRLLQEQCRLSLCGCPLGSKLALAMSPRIWLRLQCPLTAEPHFCPRPTKGPIWFCRPLPNLVPALALAYLVWLSPPCYHAGAMIRCRSPGTKRHIEPSGHTDFVGRLPKLGSWRHHPTIVPPNLISHLPYLSRRPNRV
jgi:hypothetical protein